MHNLSENIRRCRKSLDLGQKEVASRLGMSVSNYSNYENGHYKISEVFLAKLAEVFSCSTEYITSFHEKKVNSRTPIEVGQELPKNMEPFDHREMVALIAESLRLNSLVLNMIISETHKSK